MLFDNTNIPLAMRVALHRLYKIDPKITLVGIGLVQMLRGQTVTELKYITDKEIPTVLMKELERLNIHFVAKNTWEYYKQISFTFETLLVSANGAISESINAISDIMHNDLKTIATVSFEAMTVKRLCNIFSITAKTGLIAERDLLYCLNRRCEEYLIFTNEDMEALFSSLAEPYIANALDSYADFVFNLIPELRVEHKYEQHSSVYDKDLWKYTIDCINNYCKQNTTYHQEVILALLFQDIGKPFSSIAGTDGYWHYRGHSKKSAEIAKRILYKYPISNETVNLILWLIAHHHDKDISKLSQAIHPDIKIYLQEMQLASEISSNSLPNSIAYSQTTSYFS